MHKKQIHRINLIILIFMLIVVNTNGQEFNLSIDILTEAQLKTICNDEELSFLRNEIYARHGYIFTDEKYKQHFEEQDWYKPATNNKQVKLSQIEKNNVFILKKEEKRRLTRKAAIYQFLIEMKQIHAPKYYLTETMQKIDIDKIEYCGDKGSFKIKENNETGIYTFEIYINDDKIKLGYYGYKTKDSKGNKLDFWMGCGSYTTFSIDKNNKIKYYDSEMLH